MKDDGLEEKSRQFAWDTILGKDRNRKLTVENFQLGAGMFNRREIGRPRVTYFTSDFTDVRYCLHCKVEECGHGLDEKCPITLDESDANVLLREAKRKGEL